MRRSVFAAVAFSALLAAGAARSQDLPSDIPPADMRPLSEIVAKVEALDSFAYIDEINWDDDGYYAVTYFTKDKAKVEINYNPVTAEPR